MRLVDGGFLGWTYGVNAQTINSWVETRQYYASNSGSILAMDSKMFSHREKYFPQYKSRRRERLIGNEERLAVRDSVREFQEGLREDPWMNMVSFPGLEADDILTAIGLLSFLKKPITVIGIDKDLLQLPGNPLRLTQLEGQVRDIRSWKQTLPITIQGNVHTPQDVLLCLTLLGDHSDTIPRLIPPRRLDVLQSILSNGYPFRAATNLYGSDFFRNLYLAVLPGPWCFDPIPQPEDIPELLETGEYYRQKFDSQLEGIINFALANAFLSGLRPFKERVVIKSLGY